MSEYQVGDKIAFDGNFWTVCKVAPGKVLLKGYGFRKWFKIDEIQNARKVSDGK